MSRAGVKTQHVQREVSAADDVWADPDIYRILVCRPNHRLGNMLLLTPLIVELEQRYPGAEIDVLAEGTIAREVFSSFFGVRHIYCLPKRGFKHPFAFLSTLREVRRTRYDLIIDPSLGSGFSRAMTRVARGRHKLGFDDPDAKSSLTRTAPRSAAGPLMAGRAVRLLRWRPQARAAEQSVPPLQLRLSPVELEQGRQRLAQMRPDSPESIGQPTVGVFANATGAKRYPESWWLEFIARCRDVLPGQIIELVPGHGQSMLGSAWPAYYSSDIRRMASVMAALDLVISADCGVMHLAAASGAPTAGLFCVTDMAVYAPYGHANCGFSTTGLSPREVADRVAAAFGKLLQAPSGAAPANLALHD